MTIHIGSAEAKAIKIGGADATAVYAGDTQVWPVGIGPPINSYPQDPVGYKRHGHSYPEYIPWSSLDASASMKFKCTDNQTSTYMVKAMTRQQFRITAETVLLVEYKVRARAHRQANTRFSSYVGVDSEKTGMPHDGIMTSWPAWATSVSMPRIRETALRWRSSTSPIRSVQMNADEQEYDEAVESGLIDLTPQPRYTNYGAFCTLVTQSGPDGFGKNEEKIWDTWSYPAPGESGPHTTWRTAEGAFYLTVPANAASDSYQISAGAELPKSIDGRSGMEMIWDYLIYTPVTAEDHVP